MTELLFSLWPYIAGAVATIGALVWARMSGRKAERNEQSKKERQSIDKAQEVRNETNKIPDADLNNALNKWVRDKR